MTVAAWRASARRTCLAAALAALVVLAGCATNAPAPPPVAPKLSPPAITESSVLRVGVDAHYPPFAAVEGTGIVGIDADVADALAAQLGLRARLIDVPPANLADALRARTVDIGLGGVGITQAALSGVGVATSYLSDGPALFSRDASLDVQHLDGLRLAVQQGSPAYWQLRSKVDASALTTCSTLRQALTLVANGKADAAGGDALVGGYIIRDLPSLRMVAQLGEATPLAVTVAREGDAAEDPVRAAMDELVGTGVLDAIRAKWVGDLPALHTASSGDGSSLVPLPANGPSAASTSAAATGTP